MLDSPITLVLLGLTAAGAIASYAMGRRTRQPPALPTATSLSTLSDRDLLTALSALQPGGHDRAVRRRITLLIVEEIERRALAYDRYGGGDGY